MLADYAKHLWDQRRLHSGAEVRPGIAGEPARDVRGRWRGDSLGRHTSALL